MTHPVRILHHRAARLLSLLLCVLLALGCAACGSTPDETSESPSAVSGTASETPAQDEYHDASGKYWPSYSDEPHRGARTCV